jgi:hypothetical protein
MTMTTMVMLVAARLGKPRIPRSTPEPSPEGSSAPGTRRRS